MHNGFLDRLVNQF